jgi:hypothetical protein
MQRAEAVFLPGSGDEIYSVRGNDIFARVQPMLSSLSKRLLKNFVELFAPLLPRSTTNQRVFKHDWLCPLEVVLFIIGVIGVDDGHFFS